MSLLARSSSWSDADLAVAICGVVAVSICGLLGLPGVAIAVVAIAATVAAVVVPAGIAAAAIVVLPWFYHPLNIGAAHLPASELLLIAAAAGMAIRLAGSLSLELPDRRDVTLAAVRATLNSRLVIVGIVLVTTGLLLVIWPFDPAHRAESLREWRWTLAEPLLLIGIFSLAGRRHSRLVAIALIAGATLAGLQGLSDLATGGGVAVEGARRIAGPYQHPNALALYLSRIAAFGAAWWLVDQRERRWLSPAVGIIGLALLATLSRGAILAAGVAGLLILWRAPRRLRAVGYSAGAVAAVTLLVIARDRMLDLFSGGSGSLRLAIWDSALRMIADRPIQGYGNDQFLYAYLPRYVHPVAWNERFTAHAHNFILDFWVRLGIIGVAFAVVATAVILISAVRFATQVSGRDAIAGAASVGLAAVIVHGLVDNAYFAHDLAMSAWALGWLAFGRADPAQGEDSANNARSGNRRSRIHRVASD